MVTHGPRQFGQSFLAAMERSPQSDDESGEGSDAEEERPQSLFFAPQPRRLDRKRRKADQRVAKAKGPTILLYDLTRQSIAPVSWPDSVVIDRSRSTDGETVLVLADSTSHTLHRCKQPMTSDQKLELLAGTPYEPGARNGACSSARFNTITAIACDSAGRVLVAEELNACVRLVDPAKDAVSLVHGWFHDAGTQLRAVCVDPFGTVYCSELRDRCIYRLTSQGPLKIAGGFRHAHDGLGTRAGFQSPTALAADVR